MMGGWGVTWKKGVMIRIWVRISKKRKYLINNDNLQDTNMDNQYGHIFFSDIFCELILIFIYISKF